MISPSSFTGDFLQSFIEAIVFDRGVVSEDDIYTSLKEVVSREEIKAALESLENYYLNRKGGLKFVQTQDGWQFIAILDKRISLSIGKDKIGGEILKKECQVLAILLDKGSQTQKEIDYILGDDCSHWVCSLKEKGFVFNKNEKLDLSTLFFVNFGVKKREDILNKIEKKDKEKNCPVFSQDYYNEIGFSNGPW